jgi:hypothetical protein
MPLIYSVHQGACFATRSAGISHFDRNAFGKENKELGKKRSRAAHSLSLSLTVGG